MWLMICKQLIKPLAFEPVGLLGAVIGVLLGMVPAGLLSWRVITVACPSAVVTMECGWWRWDSCRRMLAKYVAAESDSVNLPVHYARILERLCAYPGVSKVRGLLRLCLLALQPLLQRLWDTQCGGYGPRSAAWRCGSTRRPTSGGLLAPLRRRRAGGFYRRLRLGRPAGGAHYSADGAEALR